MRGVYEETLETLLRANRETTRDLIDHYKQQIPFEVWVERQDSKVRADTRSKQETKYTRELRAKALWAFLGVILTISLYIAFAFRQVSRPVSSWKYGIVTLGTLFHDALIPLGLIAYLGHTRGEEINTNSIVAILVIIGFSVHDTIVVFDRIRENLRLEKSPSFNFSELVNRSMNQTMIRSLNTSLTLALTLAALLLFGPSNLFYFVLTILVGVVVGTYSSIFIASPLLTLWNRSRA